MGTELASREDVLKEAIAGQASIEALQLITGADAKFAIAEGIFSAETADDVLAAGGSFEAQGTADLVDQIITINPGVKFLESKFDRDEGQSQVYAVFTYISSDGEKLNGRTQSQTILAQLLKLETLNALPRAVRVVRSDTQTANGFYPMWLESA